MFTSTLKQQTNYKRREADRGCPPRQNAQSLRRRLPADQTLEPRIRNLSMRPATACEDGRAKANNLKGYVGEKGTDVRGLSYRRLALAPRAEGVDARPPGETSGLREANLGSKDWIAVLRATTSGWILDTRLKHMEYDARDMRRTRM